MDSEIWKPVVGFEDIYEVSNIGRIRKRKTGRIYANRLISGGYYQSSFLVNNVGYNCQTHRLVAEAFIPNPDNLPFVDHIDRDKTNNRVENLRWATRSQNGANSERKGYYLENKTNEYGTEYTYYTVAVYKDGVLHKKRCKTEEEARQTYEKLHKEIHGEFSPY